MAEGTDNWASQIKRKKKYGPTSRARKTKQTRNPNQRSTKLKNEVASFAPLAFLSHSLILACANHHLLWHS